MTSSLRALHSWLTLPEAAESLSEALGRSVTVADVLRMALDGALVLSVRLPPGTKASLLVEQDGRIVQQPTTRLKDLAQVVMDDVGKRQVQSEMHWHAGLPFISMAQCVGALVGQGGKLYDSAGCSGATGFSPRAPSSLPAEVRFGVTQSDLQAAISMLRRPAWGSAGRGGQRTRE